MAWQFEGAAFLRHLGSAVWTVYQLARYRPRTIILQHSFLLALLVAWYSMAAPWRVTVVDDIHTKAMRRRVSGGVGVLFERLRTWSVGSFDFIVVANPDLRAEAADLGPPVIVIPDPIPSICSLDEGDECQGVVAVCSFASDEPVEPLLDAMALLPDVGFAITGRPPSNLARFMTARNVVFTGFLPRDAYELLLSEAAAVVALTRDEGCLLSGGVEALGAGKPLLTSDTETLRAYFGDAARYTSPEARSIARGIRCVLSERERLRAASRELRRQRCVEHEERIRRLRVVIRDSRGDGANDDGRSTRYP